MRHRIGMILALIMTGVLFFPGSWGYLRLLPVSGAAGRLSGLPASGGSVMSDHGVLIALVAIAVPGLLAGILIAVPRISPLAAGLPGLLLLGWIGLYLASARQAVDLIPLRSDPFGAGFEAMLVSGILGAAGLAMILPMFVPSRWRAREASQSEASESETSQSEASQSEATGADELISGPDETTHLPRPQPLADQPTRLRPITTGRLAPLPAPPRPHESTRINQTATRPVVSRGPGWGG